METRVPASFSVRCQHCPEPHCVYACLTGAFNRDPDSGAVVVDDKKCDGCWTCILTCPYGSIVRDTARSKSVKYDLCPNAEAPVCVTKCPNEALVFEEGEALEKKE